MNKHLPMTERKDGNLVWVGALVLLCAAIITYGAMFSTNFTPNTAYLVGQCLVYALFTSGVFYGLTLRGRGNQLGSIAFVCIFAAYFIGGQLANSKNQIKAAQAVSLMQKDFDKIIAAKDKANGNPIAVDTEPTSDQKVDGDFGEAQRYLHDLMNSSVELHNSYQRELTAIGWTALLSAQHIKQDPNLLESKHTVEVAKAIADKYEKLSVDLIYQQRTKIQTLNASAAMKADMLRGFESSMGSGIQKVHTQWSQEKEIIDQAGSIIDLLATNKNWSVSDGRIMFRSQETLTRFNAGIARIQALAKEQEQQSKNSIAESKQQLQNIGNQVNQ